MSDQPEPDVCLECGDDLTAEGLDVCLECAHWLEQHHHAQPDIHSL